MGVISSNKFVDANNINCSGELKVTIALTAAPDIASNPTDIALVLDRSGSMSGDPIDQLKLGAKTFIDIIEEATDGTKDGVIGSGSRMGIVSFATTAVQNTQLITSVDDLKNAVDSLMANGQTNHADAFTKAIELFDPMSQNAKVIVMFTDGKTTVGADPTPVAELAKSMGITIYCIGLVGADGINVNELNEWASDPDSTHVAVTPTADDLEELFANLAANISKPGATEIKINEVVNPDFIITNILTPNFGTTDKINDTTIEWKIDKLGVTNTESAILEFYIQNNTQTGGTKKVNESITYEDAENNVVTFPDPTVTVECCQTEYKEDCPTAIDFSMNACDSYLEYDLGDTTLEGLGRILSLSTTIKNVCPNKRVALGVLLYELNDEKEEFSRGMKTFTIPAHSCSSCRDITFKNIKFVVPEDISLNNCTRMCCARNFRVKVLANYIDNNFDCTDNN